MLQITQNGGILQKIITNIIYGRLLFIHECFPLDFSTNFSLYNKKVICNRQKFLKLLFHKTFQQNNLIIFVTGSTYFNQSNKTEQRYHETIVTIVVTKVLQYSQSGLRTPIKGKANSENYTLEIEDFQVLSHTHTCTVWPDDC